MVEARTGTYASTQTAVRPVSLYDSDGGNTTVVLNDAVNKEYVITATGAGDNYFYIDPLRTQALQLIGFDICCEGSTELSGTLEKYMGGEWREVDTAYAFPYGGGTYSTTDSNKVIPIYPMIQGMFKTPYRIKATVTAACTIFCQAFRG